MVMRKNIFMLISRLTISELVQLKRTVDSSLKIKLKNSEREVRFLDISVRARNCLLGDGIRTIDELFEMSIDEFLRIRNVGKKTLDEMTELLSLYGLTWRKP
jgi:DNA-directed RNA polymerase subunit alpha